MLFLVLLGLVCRSVGSGSRHQQGCSTRDVEDYLYDIAERNKRLRKK
ncbi:MAG: hypothetical protein KDC36_06525 [Thermoleophilia bacterium]|nr:hypothetical protein [Thermoleophilia bacterium]